MELTVKLKQAIKDYKAGDAMAFNVLYEESHKYLYTCIYRVMSGNDNAQDAVNDIMQDTYVEISKYISQLEDEEKFLSWAGTIANRKCFAYLKKSQKYVLLKEEDTTFEMLSDEDDIIPEEVMQSREKQRLVRNIIDNELTEMQKLCVIAYYYNEQKQSEIAQELGIPENTVKTNLSRAKAKIKEGVLDLEKNTGTRLYSAAPLLLLLLREDILSCVVPQKITEGVLTTVSSVAAGVTTTSATAGAAGATTAATAGATGATTAASATAAGASAAASAGVTGATSAVTAGGMKALLAKIAALSLKAKLIGSVATIATVSVLGTGIGIAVQEKQAEVAAEDNSERKSKDESEDDTGRTSEESLPQLIVTEEQEWENGFKTALRNYSDEYDSFDLHDFDGDGIPEMLLYCKEKESYNYFYYDKETGKTVNHSIWYALNYVPQNVSVQDYTFGYIEGGNGYMFYYDVVWDDRQGDTMKCLSVFTGVQEDTLGKCTKTIYPYYPQRNDEREIVGTIYQVGLNNGETAYEATEEEVETEFAEAEAQMVEMRYTEIEGAAIRQRFEEFKLYGNDKKEQSSFEEASTTLGGLTEEETTTLGGLTEEALEGLRLLAQFITATCWREDLDGWALIPDKENSLDFIQNLASENYEYNNWMYDRYLPERLASEPNRMVYSADSIKEYVKEVFGANVTEINSMHFMEESGYYVPIQSQFNSGDLCRITNVTAESPYSYVVEGSDMFGSYEEDMYSSEPTYFEAYKFTMRLKKNSNSPFGFQLIDIRYEAAEE